MNKAKQDHDRLMDEAIDLAIRLQNDPDNPVAVEMIRVWRARGPDHEKVWARVAKIHGAAGKFLSDRRSTEHRERLGLTRRNFMIGSTVGLGLGAGYLFVPGALLRTRADHLTDKGEIRQVTLPDGTAATLGPDSAIALGFNPTLRHVELLEGMFFLDVAPDATKSFFVQAEELRITALETAFDVSSDAGRLTIAVERGTVEARAPDSALASGLSLNPGDWMTFDYGSRSVERGTREVDQVASWRDNRLTAENETVSALVARIGRWIPGHVVVADPFIGAQRISGIFDLNDPHRALEAAVHPTGARVRRVTSFLTVISPL